MRKYTHAVLEDAVTFTLEEWASSGGGYIPDDGSGYWVKDGLESDDSVWSSPPEDATHVAWYNK
jgi:hypothetical protein